jgi:hypothetical protein
VASAHEGRALLNEFAIDGMTVEALRDLLGNVLLDEVDRELERKAVPPLHRLRIVRTAQEQWILRWPAVCEPLLARIARSKRLARSLLGASSPPSSTHT